MDTDGEASYEKEEEALDEKEDPWKAVIAKAFKECQSKYEDRVNLRTSTNEQLVHLHLSSCSPCSDRLLLVIW